MDITNLGGVNDPFAALDLEDEKKEKKKKKKKEAEGEGADSLTKKEADAVHIRVQQRNGRKCITTVQGLDQNLDFKKILKAVKKAECCNGTVVEDETMVNVLQFQGDQREAIKTFLENMEIVDKSSIKVHGAG